MFPVRQFVDRAACTAAFCPQLRRHPKDFTGTSRSYFKHYSTFFSDFNVLRPESGGFPVGHGAQKTDYVHPHGIQKQLLQKCILQFLFGEAAACQQCSSDWACVCSRIILRHSQCRCCDGIGTREVFAELFNGRVMSFFSGFFYSIIMERQARLLSLPL